MYLEKIQDPADLRRLSLPELEELAGEIRRFLIDTVLEKGGHFASNLGSVELTLALHYVFDTPRDRLVWDVGHQAYPHKLITGRRDRFHTIRQYGGLSGFLSRSESPYDTFGAGHASTSLSAALGMAVARDLQGEEYEVVAVIGDGAMTGGMAFEAINNAGQLETKIIYVLNDNAMSIAPNVGALSRYLTRIRSDHRYHRLKEGVETLLEHVPGGEIPLEGLRRLKEGLKDLMIPTRIWEELGFTYIGPVDGHDLKELIRTFEAVKKLDGPIFVHVLTVKGKGYEPAEADAERYHGVSGRKGGKTPPSYTQIFGRTMVELAEQEPRLVAITAAMPSGTGLVEFGRRFPDRFFDVGIAEEHAVTFAAGLAAEGMRPVAAIYSTFLQRAFDQIVHDVCIQKLPVIFALDRGGLVGADGKTHHGAFDLSYLRMIPHMVLMAPKDENELRHMLYTAVRYEEGPIALRYPRGAGVGVPLDEELQEIPIGSWEVLRDAPRAPVAILAVGACVHPALEAAERLARKGIEATVVNARFIKPMDEAMLRQLAARHPYWVTVEENARLGGFGSGVGEWLADHADELARLPRLKVLALPDRFIEHGSQAQLRREVGLDAEGIEGAVEAWVRARGVSLSTEVRAK